MQRSEPPQSQLTVRVSAGAGQEAEYTLTCDPVGGNHPSAQAACDALAQNKKALQPVPKGKMCTQIFGGPETATIEGTWQGERIHAKFNKKNGCEIQRWKAMEPVFAPALDT